MGHARWSVGEMPCYFADEEDEETGFACSASSFLMAARIG
jgi:hypothetical protein